LKRAPSASRLPLALSATPRSRLDPTCRIAATLIEIAWHNHKRLLGCIVVESDPMILWRIVAFLIVTPVWFA
jgi:hypothetical protein